MSAVAFGPAGQIVSSGHDATLRLWPADEGPALIQTFEAGANALAVAPDGEIIAAGADGKLRFLAPDGALRDTLEIAPTPLVALALSRDGALIAAGGLRGQVPLVERAGRKVRATLVGPGLPVWSLAFRRMGASCYPAGRTGWCGAGTPRPASISAR